MFPIGGENNIINLKGNENYNSKVNNNSDWSLPLVKIDENPSIIINGV